MLNQLLSAVLFAVAASSYVSARQRLLLYTAVADDGFRHDSIPSAVEAMRKLGDDNFFDTVHCNDRDDFARLNLTQFDALAFISTGGSVLTSRGASNMRHYIQNGGGFVGVHEASCSAQSTPWYLRLVGAQFNYHPEMQKSTLNVLDRSHPSTQHLNDTWTVRDEMYNYQSDPRKLGATVLLGADESTYWDEIQSEKERNQMQGSPHPIAWYREGNLLTAPKGEQIGGGLDNTRAAIRKGIQGEGGDGRSWYTGLGHTSACWKQDDFLQHVLGGVQWVLDSSTIASNQMTATAKAPGQAYDAQEQAAKKAAAAAAAAASSSKNSNSSSPSNDAHHAATKQSNGALAGTPASLDRLTLAISMLVVLLLPQAWQTIL